MSRIQLSDERRRDIQASLTSFYQEVFDETLSRYRGDRLLDFFLAHLGPPVYNQGVQDARAYVLDRLDDIEGDVHEPEGSAR